MKKRHDKYVNKDPSSCNIDLSFFVYTPDQSCLDVNTENTFDLSKPNNSSNTYAPKTLSAPANTRQGERGHKIKQKDTLNNLFLWENEVNYHKKEKEVKFSLENRPVICNELWSWYPHPI